MKYRFLIVLLLVSVQVAKAQRIGGGLGRNYTGESEIVRNYLDSLNTYKSWLDTTSLEGVFAKDTIAARNHLMNQNRSFFLLAPLTFYHFPAVHLLGLHYGQDSDQAADQFLDSTLMNIYLNYPQLVRQSEKVLIANSSNLDRMEPSAQQTHPDFVDIVSPKAQEPDVAPMDLLVRKPNFWTFQGDYYLQFMQNFVSSNWYKGGQSNYSMLGNVVFQANYDNHQRFLWSHKLEMQLGFQNSRGDSIHSLMATENMIRYTDKLGLQATKNWYYTFQTIATTQFTNTYKSNDPTVYAAFMSPFNLNFSIGMDYNVNWLKKKLTGTVHLAPVALNWKYVKIKDLATRYGIDEGKRSLVDYGSEFTIDLKWQMSDLIKWNTRLYGYTSYKRTELEWENTFVFQLSKLISCNLFVFPRFDDGASRGIHGYWQLKEYLSVGFSYSL
ncbi:MAG: DUF3078 domain-containing protein [Prevotella sp.]|jgi:hypothetical protein|nr:DUF3078 domain-containing protein [Prevotella sp.]MCI1685736.1 DUF3078 domain-containing protein [Prevotella sp.]MCI1781027.1 DUF3078 domain-containing protein [Prevotella sp.]MCI1817264.1 DUF3078 domain-containing protein [Prevotella sp.]MCI1848501.1 DUF3078 domain-containing protein [Prevotella sp.]MCI2137402.1 DUF3078 domain-containing protein [Prevotella sp.]